MQKKVNFIIPYFGKFPNYMQLFLNSCGKNPEFHWTIITDNHEKYTFPENVLVVHKTFDEVRTHIQKKFDFPVVLNQPYKFCDMKPMYGFLFEEYNIGYDFWGYCDADVILGELSNFITDEMLTYNKIFTQGHMTLMKNSDVMNTLFMKKIDGKEYYKKVLQSDEVFNFDEDFQERININTICRQQGIDVWKDEKIADIYTKSSDFRRVTDDGFEDKSRNYYVWNDGKLTRQIKKGNSWQTEEYMYIHLQKRKMGIGINLDSTIFKIIPNVFTELEIEAEDIGKQDDKVKCKNLNLHYFKIRYKNLKIKLRKRMKK